MEDTPINTDKIYQHYGKEKDLESIKNGEIEGVDFLIGKEENLKGLTADMAGFGTGQSQRVIIDYDKGYGYFISKRMPVNYETKITSARDEALALARTSDEKLENWISVNLPENCKNVCISFKREIADIQIKQFKAKPLYGFNNEKEEWLFFTPFELQCNYIVSAALEIYFSPTKRRVAFTNRCNSFIGDRLIKNNIHNFFLSILLGCGNSLYIQYKREVQAKQAC